MTDSRGKGDLLLEIAPDLPALVDFGEIDLTPGDVVPFMVDPHVSLPQPLSAGFPPLRC
jgi:hypothetical protein